MAAELGRLFMARAVEKSYLAIARGWPEPEGVIDYALPDSRDRSPGKPALTRWRVLATATVPIALGKYPEQRYALVEAFPETGRYRQIRKHFHHVSHHIVGDTSHGRGDHNRLWRRAGLGLGTGGGGRDLLLESAHSGESACHRSTLSPNLICTS